MLAILNIHTCRDPNQSFRDPYVGGMERRLLTSDQHASEMIVLLVALERGEVGQGERAAMKIRVQEALQRSHGGHV